MPRSIEKTSSSTNQVLKMSNYQIDPFYGRETTNIELLAQKPLPEKLPKEVFLKTDPTSLHPQTDEFFKNIARQSPTKYTLKFESEEGRIRWPGQELGDDKRRTMVAMDKSMCNGVYICRKGCHTNIDGIIFVAASRNYKGRSLTKMMALPTAMGLPEPSIIQTRGDYIIRYYYFIEFKKKASLKYQEEDLQVLFNTLWANAEAVKESQLGIKISGFGNHTPTRTIGAKIRNIGGSGKRLEAYELVEAIKNIARENTDGIVYSFTQSPEIESQKAMAETEQVKKLANKILSDFRFETKIGQRHFFVSYIQALLESGKQSVDAESVAGELPFDVDYTCCPSNRSATPTGINSYYFWYLAKLVNLNAGPEEPSVREELKAEDNCRTSQDSAAGDAGQQQEISPGAIDIGKNDLERLKAVAAEITAKNSSLYITEQLQLLKSYSRTLRTKFDQSYIENVFMQAIMYENGSLDPLTPEDSLKFDSVPWLWEHIIIDKTANLLVAQPKTGKTTLVLSFVAALINGDSSFLGKKIGKFDGKIIIVGTDQPESDWARMFQAVGLLDEYNKMHPSINKLHTAGCPLYLDERGFETLEGYAREHKRILLILDSFAALTSILGLDENSPRAGQVIQQLVSRLSTYGVTLIIIHHSGKGMISDSPTSKSRGSTSIPAAVSQIISLSRYSATSVDAKENDGRLVVETEGRAGSPMRMFIRRTESGWVVLGDGNKVSKEQIRNETISNLTSRQKDCLKYIEEQWDSNRKMVSASDLVKALPSVFNGSDVERSARSVLNQLHEKQLIRPTDGRPVLWAPSGHETVSE